MSTSTTESHKESHHMSESDTQAPQRRRRSSKIKQPPTDHSHDEKQSDTSNNHTDADVAVDKQPVLDIAKNSPREVVIEAVSSYCSDAISTAEQSVKDISQDSNNKETVPKCNDVGKINETNISGGGDAVTESAEIIVPGEKKGPSLAESSPREVVMEAVTNYCADAISTAELSISSVSKPPASNIPVPEKDLPLTGPAEPVLKLDTDPPQPKSPVLSTPAPEKKNEASIGPTEPVVSPGKVSSPPLSKAAVAIAQATEFLDQLDGPSNSSLSNNGERKEKGYGKPKPQKNAHIDKERATGSQSKRSSGTPPASQRPAPPSIEKNPKHSDNPRNQRKKKVVDAGGEGSLPPIETTPTRTPVASKQQLHPLQKGKNTASAEEIGLRPGGKNNHGYDRRTKRTESKSAPISSAENKLPPIGGTPGNGDGAVNSGRKRKKPLYLRLEDRAKRIQMQIEKEKLDMYHKVKLKKLKAQPTKEEIDEHMMKYRQMKLAHMEQGREYAEARKKDWKKQGHQLKKKNSSPVKHRKPDFVEEQRQREREEEEARKIRIEKGKEYGDAVRGGMILPSPGRPSPRPTQVQDGRRDISPQAIHKSPETVERQRRNKRQHAVGGEGEGLSESPKGRDVPRKHKSVDGDQKQPSPTSRPPNAKRLLSQSSGPAERVDAPYEGKMGSEWVAEVMEMDAEEARLADVYETGFLMFMLEKGMITSKDDNDDVVSPVNEVPVADAVDI
mmetsp:Transcript_20871/g.30031  ORF Transcript_20871/g.30031 Transcript_20871/m.30031 type:complete len:730 (+) Transcript_20871:221-2410(+)|eukprot:CAMPEP_0185023128 /NCGR_PEP_ID=MMETSP1103-20130426/5821_1 /TAXON_ID=36769 /ORGANISM="Paraphysomonas bandaiensis, Strain Caron Lab Isolate" /LENGTH=729 /DNA_ID=CAMNT_0027555565 /DNA_START=156 /DNA_END=2345 /DNA_ORIENTATION=+